MTQTEFTAIYRSSCYCEPRHLVSVLADTRLEVGQYKTLIVSVPRHPSQDRGIRWPKGYKRFAVIWVSRCHREYNVRLSTYSISTSQQKGVIL